VPSDAVRRSSGRRRIAICAVARWFTWTLDPRNEPPSTITVTLKHLLMFPTIGCWDKLDPGKRCIFYQDVETWDLPLDLFIEGVDRRITRKINEKEFNIEKVCRFLDFYPNTVSSCLHHGEGK